MGLSQISFIGVLDRCVGVMDIDTSPPGEDPNTDGVDRSFQRESPTRTGNIADFESKLLFKEDMEAKMCMLTR